MARRFNSRELAPVDLRLTSWRTARSAADIGRDFAATLSKALGPDRSRAEMAERIFVARSS
jgi:hypothetical protein